MTENGSGNLIKIKRALISSWRKEEAVSLARVLTESGVKILASGGTADAILKAGIAVEKLSKQTGFDSLLGGRVKTIHPLIYAAILARRDSAADLQDLEDNYLKPIDLIAVDLYPYPEVAKGSVGDVELIDIGGVALIRAAAKNHQFVTVLSKAEQFADFISYYKETDGQVDLEQRRKLAVSCFKWTSEYDALIATGLEAGEDQESRLTVDINLSLHQSSLLRYGENPHQNAGFYISKNSRKSGIASIKQLGGKQLSFNNLIDLDSAMRFPVEFKQPAAVILKHTNPCGVGTGADTLEAFGNAHSTDPKSAFGSIIGFNRVIDIGTAKAVRRGFVEVVCAPGFEDDALTQLKSSKNMRIIEFEAENLEHELDMRSVWGGMLVQDRDFGFPELDDYKVVTQKKPTDEQLKALKFAWIVVRYVKSNAIIITRSDRTIGIGAGQMSRVDAAHIAVWKAGQAGLDTQGTVAASDAFFPFSDGLEVLVDAGVEAIIQPGGSIRDEEVIKAADNRGIVMVLTGRRHFRH